MTQLNPIKQQYTSSLQEHILVVKNKCLFPQGTWQGLKAVDFAQYIHIINTNKEFLPRDAMETNPAYKQIIPYLVFQHQDTFFLMQRQSKASETRLQNKFTLGIGGHIREKDLQTGASIFDWAKREFHEEINYAGSLHIKPLGILNDDSNEVGKVHIGFVLLLQGDSDNISIKSELKNGQLISLNACKTYEPSMETWSQIVFKFLEENR